MSLSTALPAGSGRFPAGNLREFDGHNTGWDRNDAVAEYHDKGSQYLSDIGLWGYITVTDRGKGNYGPVNGTGNTGETVLCPLNKVHQ